MQIMRSKKGYPNKRTFLFDVKKPFNFNLKGFF